jgi:hypothetical protein
MKDVRDQDRAKFAKYCEINDRYREPVTGTSNDPRIPQNWGGVNITTFPSLDKQAINFNNHSIEVVLKSETRVLLSFTPLVEFLSNVFGLKELKTVRFSVVWR